MCVQKKPTIGAEVVVLRVVVETRARDVEVVVVVAGVVCSALRSKVLV